MSVEALWTFGPQNGKVHTWSSGGGDSDLPEITA